MSVNWIVPFAAVAVLLAIVAATHRTYRSKSRGRS